MTLSDKQSCIVVIVCVVLALLITLWEEGVFG